MLTRTSIGVSFNSRIKTTIHKFKQLSNCLQIIHLEVIYLSLMVFYGTLMDECKNPDLPNVIITQKDVIKIILFFHRVLIYWFTQFYYNVITHLKFSVWCGARGSNLNDDTTF